jgi:uncharacterized Zn finger protein (UPF0148 family)
VSGQPDEEVGVGRYVRKSPLIPTAKLCPRCLTPLQKWGKLGGWLVPQDYYCPNCGYKGIVFLEQDLRKKAGDTESPG